MANVTITSVIDTQALIASTFEEVDTARRVAIQNGVITVNSGGAIRLPDGWVLACTRLSLNTGNITAPADPDDPTQYDLVCVNGGLIISNGTSNNANQLATGRIYMRDAFIGSNGTGTNGQYAFGSWDTSHNQYMNISRIRFYSLGQRMLAQFFRATLDSQVSDLVFTGGYTDLNFTLGIQVDGISAPFDDSRINVGFEYLRRDSFWESGEDGNNWTYIGYWRFQNNGNLDTSLDIRERNNLVVENPIFDDGVLFRGGKLDGGWIDVRRTFTPTVIDPSGSAIVSAKAYLVNGNARWNWWVGTGRAVGTSGTALDRFTTDYTRSTGTAVLTAADGTLADGGKGFYRVGIHSQAVDGNSTPPDMFAETTTMRLCSYPHDLTSQGLSNDVEFIGNVTMLFDASITETTKATVDAYTTIDNENELHDAAKAFLYDNFTGETVKIVGTNDGDIGSYDMVIDPAAQAFDFDGATITINTSNFVGNLTTTGTITLNGGAVITGIQSDSNGTTGILRLS